MNRLRATIGLTGTAVLLAGTIILSAGWLSAQEAAPPPPRLPIKVGGNVQESKLIRKVEPVYPEDAWKARISGRVTLQITVNEEGFVSDATVMSGHPLLNDAAVAAVKQWQYSPTLLNGKPVPVIATVTIVYNLKDGKAETGSGAASSVMPPNGSFVFTQAGGPDGQITFKATPIDEKGSPPPSSGPFLPPQLTTGPEVVLRWIATAAAAWPADVVKGILSYSFIVNEAGELTNFTRVQGPEIPDLERELSQVRVVSPGRRGDTSMRSWCVVEIRVP